MKSSAVRITAVLVVCLLLIIVSFIALGKKDAFASEIDRAARAAIDACAAEKDKSLCYEKVVPSNMDEGFTMEDAFAVAIAVQALDPDYKYCHVLAHNISAKETAKDPSNWKDVVARSPYGICGNGASHGAFQERFREESMPMASVEAVLAEIEGVCDERESWHPSRSQISNCVHGVGHLAMYITEGDVEKSIDICAAFSRPIAQGKDTQTCYEGVFMQVFQAIEPEDKALVEDFAPKADQALSYCNSFEGLPRSICIRESWILNADMLTGPKALMSQCAPIPEDEERTYCFEGVVMGVFSRSFEFDSSRMLPLCEKLDSAARGVCIATVAYRLIQTDWRNMEQAIAVCEAADEIDKEKCFRGMISFGASTFSDDSEEHAALCDGMPEPWKTQCAAQ